MRVWERLRFHDVARVLRAAVDLDGDGDARAADAFEDRDAVRHLDARRVADHTAQLVLERVPLQSDAMAVLRGGGQGGI